MEDDDQTAEPPVPPELSRPDDLLLGTNARAIREIVARRLFGPPAEDEGT